MVKHQFTVNENRRYRRKATQAVSQFIKPSGAFFVIQKDLFPLKGPAELWCDFLYDLGHIFTGHAVGAFVDYFQMERLPEI
jgi:hypothetical protein